MGDDVTTRQLWPLADPPTLGTEKVESSLLPERATSEPQQEGTDIAVPGRAPWDRPEPYPSDEPDTLDDRPADMLATYEEMIPSVERPIAAATAPAVQSPTSDPDDAFAPVVDDIHEQPRPAWPAWNSVEATSLAAATTAEHFPRRAVAPDIFSTASDASPEPLVLRLEGASADEPDIDARADTARPDGPWSDAGIEAEAVAPAVSALALDTFDVPDVVEPDLRFDAPVEHERVADAAMVVADAPATEPTPAWPPTDGIDTAGLQSQLPAWSPDRDPWSGAAPSTDPLAALPAATLATRLAQRAASAPQASSSAPQASPSAPQPPVSAPQPVSFAQQSSVAERASVVESVSVLEPTEFFEPRLPVHAVPDQPSRRSRLKIAGLAVTVAVIAVVLVVIVALLR